MCPHTPATAHTVCGFRRCVILLYMCPHTTIYMCPHTPVYMCPHTDGTHCLRPQCAKKKKLSQQYVSSYSCIYVSSSVASICVLILLYTCVLTLLCIVCATRAANDFACYICVYMCPRPHTTVHVSCRQCSQGRADDYGPSGLLFQLRDGPCASTG